MITNTEAVARMDTNAGKDKSFMKSSMSVTITEEEGVKTYECSLRNIDHKKKKNRKRKKESNLA